MVKVTAKRLAAHNSKLDDAIAEMMAPYDEQTEDSRYREFHDVEPENRPLYENEGTEKIRTPEGDLLWPWDDRFRVPGRFGIGSDTHVVPDDCQRVEVPFKELYATFDAFMTDYGGYTLDEGTGKYGYHRNPNAKWDGYQIGGRWRGFFPVQPSAVVALGGRGAGDSAGEWATERDAVAGASDVVRLADIDMAAVARKAREHAERFWEEWQSWLAGTYKGHAFDSPRSFAMTIGLLRVEQGPALSDHCQRAIPWAGMVPESDPRAAWHDVAKLLDKDQFFAEYIDCFNPIKTYAALDNDGWHAPGDMGWWGMSSDKPEAYVKYAKEFMGRFVRTCGPNDLLVVVDYHI
jgi:hypothetical protein